MTVDRQIDLASVYRVVWERGKRILVVTFAVMIVSYIATLFMTKRYGAMTEVEIKPSRVGERAMERWITAIEVFGRYAEGDDAVLHVIEEFDLDREPYNIRTVNQMASRIGVSRFKETSVIRIYAEMETPQMAADVAEGLAKYMIDKNLDLLGKEVETTINLLDESLSARIANNASRETEYLKAQSKYAVEIQQKYLDNLYSRWQKLMSERENLVVSTRELSVRVASLVQAVTHQPEKFELNRTLSEDLVLLEAIRTANPSLKGVDLSNLSLTIESPNPEHYTLLSEKDRLQAQMEGDRAKLNLTESLIPELKSEIDGVQNEIYESQLEVARFKAEYDRSYEIFGGIDKEYGWTFTTVFSERYDISIINHAIPKDAVVRPNRPAAVVLSGSFAFLLALAYFLLKDLYGIAQQRGGTAVG
ncbi:MAG: Wzz/FepE/Etk N-terminal domain-containing protein [bacterium]